MADHLTYIGDIIKRGKQGIPLQNYEVLHLIQHYEGVKKRVEDVLKEMATA